MNTIQLADGGLLLYDEARLPPDLADRYFAELQDTVPWEQKNAAFGRMQPRFSLPTATPASPILHCLKVPVPQ
jgi:hypothetical protein